ncbi:MAG TPA: cytochrome b N-terminal domain-containing protein [Chloroflexota bacterium]|jgi:ubiquinol-cytochrome c reductase cytochrome b subunit|nr:cytochrome b N-terminal domain-containing protein [Chloroflexota bacterium]
MMRALLGVYRWLDERLGWSQAIWPIIAHPVPRTINWWYVFGSATLVAFVMQVVTGVALAFTYVPAPNSAYDSLQWITHQALLGGVVRGIHYFGASAMVILIVVHLLRTFLMGAYKFPRELNWLTGVGLFFLTLGMAFTGQLLRWNQDAYWAVVVAAEQAARVPLIGHILAYILFAGPTVGGGTLTRFYATHVFLFPALMFVLIGLHLYLVVRHGISEPPQAGRPVDRATYQRWYAELLHRDGVPFWPEVAWRDLVFALIVGAGVLALAALVGPPELGKEADPTILQAYPRPDWYFLWYFAILALIPPQLESWVIVGFPLLVGIVLLLLPFVAPVGERSPRRRPWAVGVAGLALISIVALLNEGRRAPWSPVLPAPALPAAVVQPLTGPARHGATVFMEKGCHNCHTIAGTGGQRGPDLSAIGSRLSRDQLTWRILYGGTNMPAYGTNLQPEELAALVDFLAAQRGAAP